MSAAPSGTPSPGKKVRPSPSRDAGRPTAKETQRLGEQLIVAARTHFLAQGYHETSLDQIARAAGVHRDTVYRRYGNKESLFRAVLSTSMVEILLALQRAIGRGGRPEKVLLRAARALYVASTSEEAVSVVRMVVAESRRFPDLAASLHENWRIDLAPLIAYLAAQQAAGVLHMDDPAEAAYLFASSASITTRALLAPPLTGPSLERHLLRTVDVYLKGWRQPGMVMVGA